MKKTDVVKQVLGERLFSLPKTHFAAAFAPSNIALCKYWGKRDTELNLPVTSSLSISLREKGARINIKLAPGSDIINLNGEYIDNNSAFAIRLIDFLNLFRPNNTPAFELTIVSNIPIAAGLASSAAGFASVVIALNNLFGWQLNSRELSILARLGSGSACRSIANGFVEWHAGFRDDGMDCYAVELTDSWPELCLGLLIINSSEKRISSRMAMELTVNTSSLYTAWPAKVSVDLTLLKESIAAKDFVLLGRTAESNAMTMHATMLSAWPPISYCLPETLAAMHKVWELRKAGLNLYFTQDAGPNLKLLFLKKDEEHVKQQFEGLEIMKIF